MWGKMSEDTNPNNLVPAIQEEEHYVHRTEQDKEIFTIAHRIVTEAKDKLAAIDKEDLARFLSSTKSCWTFRWAR